MYRQVYRIDSKGFKTETIPVPFNKDGTPLEKLGSDIIIAEPPHGITKPKWTGAKWVEGATKEEIDELTKPKPSPPTATERLQALEEAVMNLIITGGM